MTTQLDIDITVQKGEGRDGVIGAFKTAMEMYGPVVRPGEYRLILLRDDGGQEPTLDDVLRRMKDRAALALVKSRFVNASGMPSPLAPHRHTVHPEEKQRRADEASTLIDVLVNDFNWAATEHEAESKLLKHAVERGVLHDDPHRVPRYRLARSPIALTLADLES